MAKTNGQRKNRLSVGEVMELEKYVEFEQDMVTEEVLSHASDSDEDLYNTPIRPRKRFDNSQVTILENTFLENDHPSREIKDKLAKQFNTTTRRIQIWFQNRRAKNKKRSDPRASSVESNYFKHHKRKDSESSINTEHTTEQSGSNSKHKKPVYQMPLEDMRSKMFYTPPFQGSFPMDYPFESGYSQNRQPYHSVLSHEYDFCVNPSMTVRETKKDGELK